MSEIPNNRILIVADDFNFHEHLVEILNNEGFTTKTAPSVKSVLKKLQQDDFDIILLDLDFMMPAMSGMDALAEIKQIKPKAKVILLSAFATIENAVRAIKKGASEFVTKPYNTSELLLIVKQQFQELRSEGCRKTLELDATLSSLSNPIRRLIFRTLESKTSMGLMQITREIGIQDHTKVIFHIKKLKESKLIDQAENKSYFLTNDGIKILECMKFMDNYLIDTTPKSLW